MSVLQQVLQYKEQQRQNELADIGQVGNAIQLFNQARQAAVENKVNSIMLGYKLKDLQSKISERETNSDFLKQFIGGSGSPQQGINQPTSTGNNNYRVSVSSSGPKIDFLTPQEQEKNTLEVQKLKGEVEDTQRAKEQKKDNVLTSAQDTLDTIGEIESGMSNFGLTGGLPSIPGSERANWEANIDKLLSKKIIDVMTSMKEASKTGATGFGQLSEKELKVLRDSSTSLKRTLKKEDAQKYLDQMKKSMQKVMGGDSKTITKEQAIEELKKRGKIK